MNRWQGIAIAGAIVLTTLSCKKGAEDGFLEQTGALASAPGAVAVPGAGPAHAARRGLTAGAESLDELRANAEPANRESYSERPENEFLAAGRHPLSTFAVDVDTASYSNVRRFLMREGALPPAGAVRIEELINYFPYHDAAPDDDRPFALSVETAQCPWAPAHVLARVALRAQALDVENKPPANLVFLLDVSGSMDSPDKLPLLQRALKLLVKNLGPRDRVAIVVYAGAAGLVLPSTDGAHQSEILEALDRLSAGGSTNGGAGLRLAYDLAKRHFIPQGINRVILCTDGDFNVGTASDSELVRLIEERRKSGVYLSVLGFGTGNLNDSMMEQLADRGNGHYVYIDSLMEAKKVLVDEFGGTLVTVAKDVKIQVEFNPARVQAYRLIGYENRLLAAEDFNDDTKDGGEIGAGHFVTALYEVVPAGVAWDGRDVDPLKYSTPSAAASEAAASDELATVKVRYQPPDGGPSRLLTHAVRAGERSFEKSSRDFRFAAAVAGFGMLLKGSRHAGQANWSLVEELAEEGAAQDPGGHRREFLDLVSRARRLAG